MLKDDHIRLLDDRMGRDKADHVRVKEAIFVLRQLTLTKSEGHLVALLDQMVQQADRYNVVCEGMLSIVRGLDAKTPSREEEP